MDALGQRDATSAWNDAVGGSFGPAAGAAPGFRWEAKPRAAAPPMEMDGKEYGVEDLDEGPAGEAKEYSKLPGADIKCTKKVTIGDISDKQRKEYLQTELVLKKH